MPGVRVSDDQVWALSVRGAAMALLLCNISQVSRINSTAKHLDVMCPGYWGSTATQVAVLTP